MKKVLILLLLPSFIFCMANDDVQASVDSDPQRNLPLMRAITASNHPAVLNALRNNQDQNYLWNLSDGEQHKAYVDLTAAMYALKILRKNNRWECASNVAVALAKDLGNLAMRYYAAQYPILNYVDPIRQSHTAALLLNSQVPDHQLVVNSYKPAKRIARDLLIKGNTNLMIARLTQWDGQPVTVETYLNSMCHSWNPVTRKDGQDLASELGQILRTRESIDQDFGDGAGFAMHEQDVTAVALGLNNRRNRLRYILLDDDSN